MISNNRNQDKGDVFESLSRESIATSASFAWEVSIFTNRKRHRNGGLADHISATRITHRAYEEPGFINH